MDFSDVSQILMEEIHDVIDHAFVVYEGDDLLVDLFSYLPLEQRIVKVQFIPTAENLAKWAYDRVAPKIKSVYGNKLRLKSMHVRETPKSWATWTD